MFESSVFFRRWLCFCLLGALLLPGLSCQRTPETEAEADAREGGGNGSVWVVDDSKTGGRLFLCGTIHILRDQDYPLAPGYEAAYANSNKLVLELPPGSGSGSALAARMGELGTYPSGTNLEAHVGAATWQNVKKWAATRQADPAQLERYRPWYLSLIITSTEYGKLQAKAAMGVDQHFETRAARDGKPGVGLETAEFQMQLFTRLTEAQQQDLLEQTLKEVADLPQEYEKMIVAWKKGQLDVLHEMLFKEAEKYPDLMDLFLTSRNKAWIAPLEGMLQKGEKVMVLVGTGHMASKTGLLQLLRDRGYTVRHYSEVKDL